MILPPVPICFKCKPKSCPYYDCMEKIKAEHIVWKVKVILKEKIRERQNQKTRSSFDGVDAGIDA